MGGKFKYFAKYITARYTGGIMLYAGVVHERLNLIIFNTKQHLLKLLDTLEINVDEENIIDKNNQLIECSCCEERITLDNLGNIMPGSKEFFCDDPTCLAEYISEHYPEPDILKPHELMSTILATAIGKDALNILKKTLFDFHKISDEYNIHLRDSLDANILLIDNGEVLSVSKKLFDKSIFGIGKETLLPIQIRLVNQHRWHKELIRKLKPYLTKEDHEALIIAYTIIRLEDDTIEDLLSLKRIINVRERFEKKYKENGKRIYNMARSRFIEDIIYPSMEICETKTEDKVKRINEGTKIFNEFLGYNPINIYVPTEMSDEGLITEMKLRLLTRNEPIIRIYGRRENWDRIKNICSGYVETYPEYAKHYESYTLGVSHAGCCRIWKEELGDLFEVERDREQQELQKIKMETITNFEIELSALKNTIELNLFKNICKNKGIENGEISKVENEITITINKIFKEKGITLTEDAMKVLLNILIDCMEKTNKVLMQSCNE